MAQKVVKRNGISRFWNAEDYEAFITDFLTDGIVDASGDGSDLEVTEQSPQAMGIDVAVGRAYMDVTYSGMSYKERIENTATEQVDVNANATGNVRVDAVIARIDVDVAPSSTALNIGTVEVILGTGISALSDAYIQSQIGSDSFIRLADIDVPDSASSIIDSYITDSRSRCSISGYNTVYTDNVLPIASGVNVNGFEFRDDAYEVTERADNPITPATSNWKAFFKSDGLYIIKDDGTVTKVQTGGTSTTAKAEASASDGELFENTDDGNVLAHKDSGSVVHNVVESDMIGVQTDADTITDSSGSSGGAYSNSGNADIDVTPFESGDIVKIDVWINMRMGSANASGKMSFASIHFSGIVGGEEAGFAWSDINTNAPDIYKAGVCGSPYAGGNITLTINDTATGTFTISPPTWSGNNLRFHWTHAGNLSGAIFIIANSDIVCVATRLSKKA